MTRSFQHTLDKRSRNCKFFFKHTIPIVRRLPQHLEEKQHALTQQLKEQDLNQVLKADGILVNFNGTDLDSGTVIEFITAKMVNKPAVVLRTDFRNFTGAVILML
jgi:nucleoside 2-deoxyribosyltransferase